MKLASKTSLPDDLDVFQLADQSISMVVLALEALKQHLPPDLEKVVRVLYDCKGKVVLTGMGKNGHIAQKISATLSSTGTPSHFIHPAEASHGDLGALKPEDVLWVISHSGNTQELNDILYFAKENAIPIIGMTSGESSKLATACDYKVLYPKTPEACPHNLAPTTSTATALVLGDAISMILMRLRDFQPQDFGRFHPGGSLGNDLKVVCEIMRKGGALPLVNEQTTMAETIMVMTEKSLGCAGILNDQKKLVGIITDGDLRRALKHENLLSLTAKAVMHENPITIESDHLVGEALAMMLEHKITNVFVTEKGKVTGILHVHDCFNLGLKVEP